VLNQLKAALLPIAVLWVGFSSIPAESRVIEARRSEALNSAIVLSPLVGRGQSLAANSAQEIEPGRALLLKLEQAIRSGPDAYLALVTSTADRTRAREFAAIEFGRDVTRVVLLERDREPVTDVEGVGLRLMIDAFIEFGARGRVATWQLQLRRTVSNEWLVASQERLSSVDNLYRLFLNPDKQFDARAFTVRGEDLDLTLDQGSVFTVDVDQKVTALVLLGRGTMRFHPSPQVEKRQLEIFSGSASLESRFDAAYVRLGDLATHADMSQLTARAVDTAEFRRAELVFQEESAKSFAFDLSDFTSTAWTLLPATSDLLAEIRTRRFGTLTYSRSTAAAEDISLFDRVRQKNIAVYPSAARLAARGPFFRDDDQVEYDVRHYDIDVAFDPARRWIDGQALIRLAIGSTATSQIALRLAPGLVVQSVTSDQFGRLFSIRVRNQDTLLITLPALLLPGTDVALTVTYSGRLAAEPADWEMVMAGQRPVDPSEEFESAQPRVIQLEPRFLYSNRSYWYPRPAVGDYATATLRLTIPAAYDCIASGEQKPDLQTVIDNPDPLRRKKRLVFSAERPLRYLSFFVTRLSPIQRLTVNFDDNRPAITQNGAPVALARYNSVDLSILVHAGLASRARDLAARTEDILRFYHSLTGDAPYSSLAFALIEGPQPGGHSPGYFAVLSQPPVGQPRLWRNDPAAFDRHPDFFPAHEIAHQWWGQAVGWDTYHDQWLSEGFAQYFAALYLGHQRGDEVFRTVMGDMRKWALRESDQGPISLGYRLGHVQDDTRVFRALVYDKGAVVLHMLRRLLGDEAFFGGLRRFYAIWRYRKAGTEDLRLAMEAESGRSLRRFFDGWVHGAALPELRFSYRVQNAAAGDRREVILRVDQTGELFDVPVTVELQYTDRAPVRVTMPVTDRINEMRVALTGTFRRAEVRDDDGTLAEVQQQ